MSGPWTHADYAARVGSEVALRCVDVDGPATPARITGCSDEVRSGAARSWTVTVTAAPDGPREQGLYTLDDADPVLLVPEGADAGAVRFVAVFNQVDPTGSES